MNLSWSKSNWNGISFWKYFKIKFFGRKISSARGGRILQWQGVKIAHIAEFTTSKFCTFNDFFHFLGLNWSFKHVKYTILVLQKQLESTKYFLIFILAVWKIRHLLNKIPFQNNKVNVQKQKHKIMLWLSDLSAQPIDEICLFSVMTVYNTRS